MGALHRWTLRCAHAARRSLIFKITLPTVLVVLVLSFLSAWALGWLFAETHEVHSGRRAERFSTAVEAAFRREMENDHADLGPFLRLLCGATYKTAFVTDRVGRVRFSCSGELVGATLDADARAGGRAIHDGVSWVRRVSPIAGGATCARCHGATDPVGYIGVDSPVEEAESEVREQQRVNLVAGSVQAVGLSLVLVLVQLVLVYRPVRRLTDTVGRIRASDLAARAPVSFTGDEIDRLGQSINDMAASIEGAKLELERTYRSELAHSTKLAALGRMASTVAHEIKNPLAGIIGALRVLESDATIPPPAQGTIGKVLAQVDRLSKTVVAALDFARPVPPSVTQTDLVELLARVISFVEPQAAEQKVQIRTHLPARTVIASVDPDLMKQVFLNLLLNGIEAMPRGGALHASIRPAQRGMIEVEISDQGAGIPGEHLGRLFTPFFSTKPGGTGLGLHVVRQIVETHNGRVRVDSTAGRGASFTVQLPAEEAGPDAPG